eukprot:190652-Chlamydomonas_euryale.AAC.2
MSNDVGMGSAAALRMARRTTHVWMVQCRMMWGWAAPRRCAWLVAPHMSGWSNVEGCAGTGNATALHMARRHTHVWTQRVDPHLRKRDEVAVDLQLQWQHGGLQPKLLEVGLWTQVWGSMDAADGSNTRGPHSMQAKEFGALNVASSAKPTLIRPS